MAKAYTSENPEVVMDRDTNSANSGMIKRVTVEEWYDLLHHTHKVEEFVNKDLERVEALAVPVNPETGGGSGGIDSSVEQQILNQIAQLTSKVESLTQTVESQQAIIEQQSQQINDLIANPPSSGGIDVIDWDATTPEIDPAPKS